MSVPSTPLTIGTVLNGKTSWFGGPHDPTSGPTTASGSPISAGGIAVYNEATLGGYWRVTFPNGRTGVFKQTDIGPAPFTGRIVDVAYSSLAAAGYNESDFPTNGQVRAEYLGKTTSELTAAKGGGPATPVSPSAGKSGGLTSDGLLGIGVKALVYLALLFGGAALLWLGTSTALHPRPRSAT